MAATIEVKYFNTFILRKVLDASDLPSWNGSRGDRTYPAITGATSTPYPGTPTDAKNWAVEEARIVGGYNNTSAGYGVKAYLVEDNPNSSRRGNAMIYSGIFNSRTGINDTNVFSVGTDITKAVDPANGSIQKLYAEDTRLIILQERKSSFAPINKDIIYTAEGGGTVTASNSVIGDIVPYTGNFGISRNPESFAVYGRRKYYTDKDRNAVLRLSQDGLTEISNYGMIDFFRDQFGRISETGKLIGGWDIYNKQYVLCIKTGNARNDYKTLSFDEQILGWTSFYSYQPTNMISLKANFYTAGPTKVGQNPPSSSSLYQHYVASQPRANFYGVQYSSDIIFIFNPNISLSKVFKTVNYEGSNGWQITSFDSDTTGVASVGYLASGANDEYAYTFGTFDYTTGVNYRSISVLSYNEGSYDNYGNSFPSTLIPPLHHAGFARKENKYMANLVNFTPPNAGEVVYRGDSVFGDWLTTPATGIKGYFATVHISTDQSTDLGGMKELFAVSSDYVESAY